MSLSILCLLAEYETIILCPSKYYKLLTFIGQICIHSAVFPSCWMHGKLDASQLGLGTVGNLAYLIYGGVRYA